MSLQGDYQHLLTPGGIVDKLNSIILSTPTGIKPEEMAALWPKGRRTKIIDREKEEMGFFEVVDTRVEGNGVVISFRKLEEEA